MIDQDNYAGRSSWKTFSTLLSVLYNYFDSPTKLFSDLYLAKFVCTLAKSFRVYKAYVCIYIYIYISKIFFTFLLKQFYKYNYK